MNPRRHGHQEKREVIAVRIGTDIGCIDSVPEVTFSSAGPDDVSSGAPDARYE